MDRIQKLKQLYDSANTQALKLSCKNSFLNQKQQQVQQGDPHFFQPGIRPQCPLTMEKINRKDLYVADCLHCFDKESIREWVEVRKNLTCPICRQHTVGFKANDKYHLGNRHLNYFSTKDVSLGGWVAHTARVGKEVIMNNTALVYGNARVSGNAQITGRAHVYDNARVKGTAKIMDDAHVYGNAYITGTSQVADKAHVYDHASVENSSVFDGARVYGDASISGDSEVQDHAHVYGNARVSFGGLVKENARVFGDGSVGSRASVRGNATVSGNAVVSRGADVGGNAKIGGKTKIAGQIEVGGDVVMSQDITLQSPRIKKIMTDAHKRQALQTLTQKQQKQQQSR